MNYTLKELPFVNKVEILRLGNRLVNNLWVRHNVLSIEGLSGVQVEGEMALRIAQLWRDLPFAEEMRCHTPPFALRFFNGDALVLQCSLCWGCNNIWIIENNVRKYADFDANAQISQQLLQILEDAVPVI